MQTDQNQLQKLLAKLSDPVFLARESAGPFSAITLHTVATGGRRRILRELKDAVGSKRLYRRFRVAVHDPDRLDRIGTLAQLVRRFGRGATLYDPTGAIEGADRLVRSTHTLRRGLRKDLRGIYFVPRSRDVYVVLKPARFIRGDKLQLGVLRDAENRIRACFGDPAGAWRTVNIGFSMPPTGAVPVDQASWHRAIQLPGKLPAGTIAAALAALLGMGPALADGPAVSGINAKISASGGLFDEDGGGLVSGSVAAPVPFDNRFGVQLDGIAGAANDGEVWGVGGQIFWRDPQFALFGAAASHMAIDSVDATRIVGTSEIYFDRFSILASGGYVFGDVVDGGVGGGEFRWYPIDDGMAFGGVDWTEGTDATALFGFEYMPGLAGLSGLSVFGDGAVGDDFEVGMAGIRFYFGSSDTLRDRHRRDDPGSAPFGSFLRDRNPDESYGGAPTPPVIPQ